MREMKTEVMVNQFLENGKEVGEMSQLKHGEKKHKHLLTIKSTKK